MVHLYVTEYTIHEMNKEHDETLCLIVYNPQYETTDDINS
jgi:hypothetical protein